MSQNTIRRFVILRHEVPQNNCLTEKNNPLPPLFWGGSEKQNLEKQLIENEYQTVKLTNLSERLTNNTLQSGLHWDFMIENGETLLTWSLNDIPNTSEIRTSFETIAQKIFDHRRLYLDYEGAVSNHRGIVRRWDSGTGALFLFSSVQYRNDNRKNAEISQGSPDFLSESTQIIPISPIISSDLIVLNSKNRWIFEIQGTQLQGKIELYPQEQNNWHFKYTFIDLNK